MTYINNNNSQTDKQFLETNNETNEKNYLFNRIKKHNHEYLSHHDPDYSNLLKQYNRETVTDGNWQRKYKTDFRTPKTFNHDFLTEPERNLTENWLIQNEKNLNTDSSINPSDDEALENYLNDLAKNYDDIDRRIRNAESFVSKMEESQNTQFSALNYYPKLRSSNYTEKSDNSFDNKIKYITELRVNISDNLKTDNFVSPRDNDQSISMESSRGFACSGNSGKHYQEPLMMMKKPSINDVKPSVKDRTNVLKSKILNISSNQNYRNLVSDCQSPRSKSSSISNSTKLDLEQINISPPEIFNTNYKQNTILKDDREIQTNSYFGCKDIMFSKYIFEDRSIQTMSLEALLYKETNEIGVSTDSQLIDQNLKRKSSKVSSSSKNPNETDIEISETEKSIIIPKSPKKEYSEIVLEEMENNEKPAVVPLCKKVSDIKHKKKKPNKTNDSSGHVKGNQIDNSKKLNNNAGKFDGIKSPKKYPNQKEDNNNLTKVGLNHKVDFQPGNQDNKDCAKNASFEIQKLLENLGCHLKASMNKRESRAALAESPVTSDSSTPSFWDNPLHKTDLISAKITPVHKVPTKPNELIKKTKRSSNIINSELQAICKTIEKNKKFDNRAANVNVEELSLSDNESSSSIHNNILTLRSESLDVRQSKKPLHSPIRSSGNIKKSNSNLNLSGDIKFPSNFKVFRSFELNPYDDIIKAHLSPLDRRVKSVAAKNGCRIVIDGPINSYDPLSCQAFRNKVTYRCTVAGPNKENLDKCMNYLKETFPNTFLKVNARSG